MRDRLRPRGRGAEGRRVLPHVGRGPALVPVTAAQPAVLAAAAPLATPASTRASDLDLKSRLRFAPPRPLDHVPLLFG